MCNKSFELHSSKIVQLPPLRPHSMVARGREVSAPETVAKSGTGIDLPIAGTDLDGYWSRALDLSLA